MLEWTFKLRVTALAIYISILELDSWPWVLNPPFTVQTPGDDGDGQSDSYLPCGSPESRSWLLASAILGPWGVNHGMLASNNHFIYPG